MNPHSRERVRQFLYTNDFSPVIHQLKLMRLFEFDLRNAFHHSHHLYGCFTPFTIKQHYKHWRGSEGIDILEFRKRILSNK